MSVDEHREVILLRDIEGLTAPDAAASLEFDRRKARIRLERTIPGVAGTPCLQPVCETELS